MVDVNLRSIDSLSLLFRHKKYLKSSSSGVYAAIMAAIIGMAVSEAILVPQKAYAQDLLGNIANINGVHSTGGRGNGEGGDGVGGQASQGPGAEPVDGNGGDAGGEFTGSNPGGGGLRGKTTIELTDLIIMGGDGGEGANNAVSTVGGGGGGAGVFLDSLSSTTNTGLAIVGGNGGGSRMNGAAFSGSGGGGGGAGAIVRGGSLTVVEDSAIMGGAGGNARSVGNANFPTVSVLFTAGAGGDGLVAQSASVENRGTLRGGNGGAAVGSRDNLGAMGGAGARLGDNATLINSGTIIAGTSTGNAPISAAIYVVGNNSTVELRAGTAIQGNVEAVTGTTGNRLVLGGAADAMLDLGTVGTKFTGFEQYLKQGVSRWALTGSSTSAMNWTIDEGTLAISGNGTLGNSASVLNINGGTLEVSALSTINNDIFINTTDSAISVVSGTTTLTNSVSGSGRLNKTGSGTLIAAVDLSLAGGTAVEAGTLQIGDGGVGGSIAGNIFVNNGGTLAFNHSNAQTFSGSLSGAGALIVNSTGALALNGNSSTFTGTAAINGPVFVNNNLGARSTTVSSTGKLGGTGTLDGNTTVQAGGTLMGVQGTKLSFGGDLTLNTGSVMALDLSSPSNSALFDVGGSLTLAGKMNIAAVGGFGPGTYRIFDYAGQLVNRSTVQNDLSFGALPTGVTSDDLTIVTGVANQVSLANIAGAEVNFWDGGDPGNGAITGGTGTWNASNRNWTDATGMATSRWKNDQFGIFQGTGGTVTVSNADGQVQSSGMQFAVDGYIVDGQPLLLQTSGTDAPVVRVGDGTADGADMTARIAAELQGTQGLRKTDFGTLILSGANTYSGGTFIDSGVLQVGSDQNLGAASNAVNINGGTLQTSANFNTARNVVLGASGGVIDTQTNTNTVSGVISGAGELTKRGAGTLVLTGENVYTGGTTINGGIIQVGDGGTNGSINGPVNIADSGSRLVVNLSKNVSLDGVISGAGGLTQAGSGTTTLTAANTYVGETQITDGVLLLSGNGSIANSSRIALDAVLDVAGVNASEVGLQSISSTENGVIRLGNKTLNLTDAKNDTFAGTIEGAGGRVVLQEGTQRLSGENTYGGGTAIDEGATLIVGNGATKGSILGPVTVDGLLVYDRSDRYAVNQLSGGGDLELRGGGTGVVSTVNSLTGEVTILANSTLALQGAGDISAAAGVTSNGTLDISGSGLDAVNVGHLRGENTGEVVLGSKDLVITKGDGSDFAGTISGTGDFVIQNGKQILSGTNSSTGTTRIGSAGELQLGNGSVNGSITGDLAVAGFFGGSGSVNNLANSGIINPGTDTSFGVLTVNGNYSSDGGQLILNTALGDDNSPTDKLVVIGSTSGSTAVTVLNRDGLGAQTVNGIKVIEVGGQSNGVFNLNGDYVNYRGAQAVVAGAYAYTLEKDGVSSADGDWYLRSQMKNATGGGNTPEFQPGVPIYSGTATGLALINRGGFAGGNFSGSGSRIRLGINRSNSKYGNGLGNSKYGNGSDSGYDADGDGDDENGSNGDSIFRERYFWGRVQGGYSRIEPSGSATGNTFSTNEWKLQTGLDGQFIDNTSGLLFGSVWIDYSRNRIRNRSDLGNGTVKVDGYGLGSAISWYGDNGFYVDGQGKLTWYRSDLDSDLIQQALATGVKSFGYALSLEAGKTFAVSDQWSITPQAQLIWSSLKTDNYSDVFNSSIRTPTNDSLTGRVGVSADYVTRWMEADNTMTQLTVGGVANIHRELKSGADYITVSDVRIATGQVDKTWGEFGPQFNYSWGNNAYALFGGASTATSLENFGDSYSVSGNIGFRVKW